MPNYGGLNAKKWHLAYIKIHKGGIYIAKIGIQNAKKKHLKFPKRAFKMPQISKLGAIFT